MNSKSDTVAQKTEVQNVQTKEKKTYSKSLSGLKVLFENSVIGQPIYLDIPTIECIITSDLLIDVSDLEPDLVKILPYMLICYLKSWPGWTKAKEYRNGSLKLDDWYEKFRQYASFKLKFLIKKDYDKVLNELRSENLAKNSQPPLRSVETQCLIESKNSKSFAPFRLDIDGPPRLLNTLIFAADHDNVHLKMHSMKPWVTDFHLQQLLNWPFLEVEFTSPFINFTRKLVPDYLRYLARTDDTMLLRRQDFIEEVRVEGAHRTTYSVSFIRQYMEQYIAYLKAQSFEGVVIQEICFILNEFFRDITEVGRVCNDTIHDSTRILFNIGGCRYVRNKKTVSIGTTDRGAAVGLCEVITPKCSIMLKKLLDLGELNTLLPSLPDAFFHLTETALKNQHRFQFDKRPSLMYSCNYCKKQYEGLFALEVAIQHYQKEHRMEHAVMCFDCKKQFDVLDLSKSRWYHDCESYPGTVNPSSAKLNTMID